MKLKLAVFVLSCYLCIPSTTQAAFYVTPAQLASTAVCDTPELSDHRSAPTVYPYNTRNKKEVHGAASLAVTVALLGAVAAVGFFVVLPFSVGGAVALAILTILLGAVALLIANKDENGTKPHIFANVTAVILGALEVAPVPIPVSFGYLIYDLFRRAVKRGKTNRHLRK